MSLIDKNSDERDNHISYDEELHIYTVDGDKSYISVTEWIDPYFSKSDYGKEIDKLMSNPNWYNHEHFGKTKEEILQIWDNNDK